MREEIRLEICRYLVYRRLGVVALQLRYLQTLLELGADQNSTVVFPLPMDIIGPLLERFRAEAGLPGAGEDGE